MEVKIWSDIRCPFCYIGKRKFELALEKFEHKDNVKIEWKSFELDPTLETNTRIAASDHLAVMKGISRKQVTDMQQYVVDSAKEIGLDFHLDKCVIANSFKGHKLIQFAKQKELANEMEEALFKAHFVEGKNIDDEPTLISIGNSVGFDSDEIKKALTDDELGYKVRQDEMEAESLSIRGVPFFVFENKYAVSGAQPPEVFLGAMETTWNEMENDKNPVVISEGNSCSTDGNCD